MREGPVEDTAGGVVIAGRYRLREPVDGGAVARAVDEESGRGVVLERVTPGAVAHARIAATVHHRHLVRILDVVEEHDVSWIVRDEVPARSLAELVGAYGPMPDSAAAEVGAQVASGLAAAHSAGIAHGDLVPDSILVAEGGDRPLAMLSGLGAVPVADPRSDVCALGAALSVATGGRAADPLTPVLHRLTADDPAARPTAEWARLELARVAAGLPAAPAPPSRRWRRVPGVVAAAVALVIAVIVAMAILPSPAPVASVPPISPADERRADPCSLIDLAALTPIGPATILPGVGLFSACFAAIPMGADDLMVVVDLMNDGTAGRVGDPRRDALNPVVVPAGQNEFSCTRHVLLPDGHVVAVDAILYGDSRNVRTDYCAVAGIAADAVVARLVSGALTFRTSDADRSALDDLRACDLLDQEWVTAAAGAASGDPAGGPIDGAAGWSCDWGPVELDFSRTSAPGAPDFYGDRVTIGGRPGMTRSDGGDGHCRAYVPQRFFIAADGAMRAEYVRVLVNGAADTATTCRAAVELAERVATRLPGFG